MRWLALTVVIAGCTGRVPLPERLRVNGAADLLARMDKQKSPAQRYSAEARLTYFGSEGRIRTTATVVTARPASLRYDVQGPHGGVLTAFATNGLELELLDLAKSEFFYGRATPTNIDRLLPFAPLGLGPDAWVRLMFGEVDVPASATLNYDDAIGRFVFTWTDAGVTRRLEVDPETSRAVRAVAMMDKKQLSEVVIEARDNHGIPETLHIKVEEPKVEVDVKLRDLEIDPEIDPSAFVIEPPNAVQQHHLGDGT